MHALPEGVGVQLQAMGMCPGYQVSVVVVVPRCRPRCKCRTKVQVSEHGVKAIDSLCSAAIVWQEATSLKQMKVHRQLPEHANATCNTINISNHMMSAM